MRRAKKPISEEQKQQIIANVKNGEAISRVAKKNGIGFSRIDKWLTEEGFIDKKVKTKSPEKYSETDKECLARKQTVLARAYWDRLKIGQAVRLKIERPRKDEEKGEFLIFDGNVIDKNKHFITVLSNSRKISVSFADVISKEIKIIPQILTRIG